MNNHESSSGCESGWTMYLDQSSDSAHYWDHFRRQEKASLINQHHQKYTEDDLSMLSDASSGPPNFPEYETSYSQMNPPALSEEHKKKGKPITKEPAKGKKQRNSCLDDTASSPVFHFSQFQDNVGPSGYLSAAQVKLDESEPKRHGAGAGSFKSGRKGKSGNSVGRKKN